MKYALGNMLNGAGSINPDGLALDLQFAADKTLTARRGPTPVLTRASTATFVGSNGLIQSAAINAPRFDHDPVTLASRGLLIEEQRTNLLVRSQEFNLTWGTNNSMTVTPDAVIAPDGTMTADAINFDSNVTSRIIQFAGSAAIHTFSVWLRANSATTCILDGQAIGAISSPAVVNVTTNWQRFTYLASNFLSGTSAWNIRIQNNSTGTSGTIFAWGAQLEAGSFATSYIPTTTSALTRSADVCNITGADFTNLWNTSEGTMFGDFSMVNGYSITGRSLPLFWASNNTFNDSVRIGSATSSLFPVIDSVISGTQTRAISSVAISLSSRNKTAGAYKVGDNGISTNGSVVVTSSPAAISTLLNRIDIGGSHPGSGVFPLSGHIAAIRYYKKRLPNAKLVTLTT